MEIKDLKSRSEEFEKKIAGLEKKKDQIGLDREKALEPLWVKHEKVQKEIKDCREPHDTKERNISNQISDLELQKSSAEDRIEELERIEVIAQSKKEGKFNVESIKVYAKQVGLETPHTWGSGKPIIEKKPLKNGIQIFRFLNEESYSEWFFFSGTKLVGYSYRRAGRHMGDTTMPFSFLAPFKEEGDAIKIKKKTYWGMEDANATFKDLCKIIEEKDPKKLKEINLATEDVRRIVVEHKGLNW